MRAKVKKHTLELTLHFSDPVTPEAAKRALQSIFEDATLAASIDEQERDGWSSAKVKSIKRAGRWPKGLR